MNKAILSLLILTSCTEKVKDKKVNEYAISCHSPLEIVTIEGCEYLFGDWERATVLTHKGNCKNPIHLNNLKD